MSWKASGYVKELRQGLTVTEKFVLLTLADYHRTDDKLAWPSVATLAADCLMTERGVQQILARLIENGFIFKTKEGGGRGNVAGYQIAGVDVRKDEPQTPNGYAENRVSPQGGALKGERNPAQPTSAIRKEPIEPDELDKALRFTRPTLAEVQAYCTLRGNSVDAEAWMDHYQSKGWKVGSAPMKDWQAAVRTWEHNAFGNGNRKGKGTERHERQIESLRATRKQAHEILRRREQTNQQDAMDFRQTADDVRGDEQTGAEWGSSGDNGAGSSQRVIRRSTS